MATPPPPTQPEASQSWTAVDDANRLLRDVSKAFDFVAKSEGWSTRFTPVRFLVLAHLHHATAFGLTPKRLAWLLRVPPSSLAHHLNVLEDAGMVERRPRNLHDGRAVTVRLTLPGLAAYLRLEGLL